MDRAHFIIGDNDMTFEEQIAIEIQNSVLQEIRKNSFLRLQYEQKKVLPEGILDKLWESVNWNEVIETIRPEVQKTICNTVIGAMKTEIKTDVKKLMAISGVREKLRMDIYPKMMQIFDDA